MYRVYWGKVMEDIRPMKVAMKGYRWGQTGGEGLGQGEDS